MAWQITEFLWPWYLEITLFDICTFLFYIHISSNYQTQYHYSFLHYKFQGNSTMDQISYFVNFKTDVGLLLFINSNTLDDNPIILFYKCSSSFLLEVLWLWL
jgi:hypothetical protein